METNNPEDDRGEVSPPAGSSPPPPLDPAALQKRVEYLEWLTGMMARDLGVIRARNPALFPAQPAPAPPGSSVRGSPVGEAPPPFPLPPPIAGAHHAPVYAQPLPPTPRSPATRRARNESLESQLGSRV